MAKLLLQSAVLMALIIPIHCARDRSALRGFKRTAFFFLGYSLFYVFALKYLYFRLL
jgi:hypothetical protein